MIDKLIRLVDAICEVYDMEDLKPSKEYTYCNIAVHFVCKRLGYEGFKNLVANEIIDKMIESDEWKQIREENVQKKVNYDGELIIAGKKDNPHGHVCVIRPGFMIYSNKWKKYVPKCMNVGKKNFIGKIGNYNTGVNWAFSQVPDYYMWKNY